MIVEEESASSGLSTGAKAGIAVGVIILVIVVVLVVVVFCIMTKRNSTGKFKPKYVVHYVSQYCLIQFHCVLDFVAQTESLESVVSGVLVTR